MRREQIARELVKLARELDAALFPDFGIVDGIMKRIKPELSKIRKLVLNEDAKGLRKLNFDVSGSITDIADNSMPTEMRDDLEDRGFSWSVRTIKMRATKFRLAAYDPGRRQLTIDFNTEFFKYVDIERHKTKLLQDISKTDVSVRHEVTHLLRDAATGNIDRYIEKLQKDESVREHYNNRGHQELEFEIDATINGLDQLRKRFGPERFDKLTPRRIEELMVATFPKDIKTLSKWVNRLMREDMLTTGMKKQWRLK